MLWIKKLFLGFSLAFSMLSIIPFFKVHHFYKGINGFAVMFYPLVGLILGSILALFFYLFEGLLPETYLYVLTFALWVLLTGALHLDGVADVLDALFVSRNRREAVLKDPHIGAMGFIFTLLFMIIKLTALMQVDLIYLLPMLLMLSRFNAVIAIYFFDYIRKDGMGSLAKEELKGWQVFIALVMISSIGFIDNSYLFLWMLVALLLSLLLTYGLAKKYFGGFSGDLYGLLIEMSELFLLHIIMFRVAV